MAHQDTSPKMTVAELAGPRSAPLQLIDVRSLTEFRAEHIPGAVNIPLDEIEIRLADLDPRRPIVLICQGGTRAGLCATHLAGCRDDVTVLEGGTNAWRKAGLPLVSAAKVRWSLERQVRLGAGLLVFAGILLAVLVSPLWLALSGFVGVGLIFAGLTDFCPMGILLARMPWNAARQCIPAATTADKVSCC